MSDGFAGQSFITSRQDDDHEEEEEEEKTDY